MPGSPAKRYRLPNDLKYSRKYLKSIFAKGSRFIYFIIPEYNEIQIVNHQPACETLNPTHIMETSVALTPLDFLLRPELAGGGQSGFSPSQWWGRALGWFQAGSWPWFGDVVAEDAFMPWVRSSMGMRNMEEDDGGSNGGGSGGFDGSGDRGSVPFYHEPVMLNEVLEWLRPREGQIGLDGTLGGGGHAEAMLRRGARVVAMDQDPDALRHARQRLKSYGDRFVALRGNFRRFPQILSEAGISGVDTIMVDLGISSHHVDSAGRGFSFMREGPLDMRMDPDVAVSAADLLATADADELAKIFRDFGDEPAAWKIACAIVKARGLAPLRTTTDLTRVVESVVPRYGKRHPATKVFQALRVYINDEIGALREFLEAAPRWLKPGGRLLTITFQSQEDRCVKHAFQHFATPTFDRPEWPSPKTNPDHLLKILTRKPIEPSEEEIKRNPRARSAKIRVAERLPVHASS